MSPLASMRLTLDSAMPSSRASAAYVIPAALSSALIKSIKACVVAMGLAFAALGIDRRYLPPILSAPCAKAPRR
jgi:hypothetical protein